MNRPKFGELVFLCWLVSVTSVFLPVSGTFGASLSQDPASSTPYITSFRLSFGPSNPVPFVLYPAHDGTVWVVAVKTGNTFFSQIINFTAKPTPTATVVRTLPGAVPSNIVDDGHGKVWYPVNDTLRFYDTTKKEERTAAAFEGGNPQYITIDSQARVWVTLTGSDRIGMYDETTNTTMSFQVPTRPALLQGISIAPDGSVWAAESASKRLARLDPNTSNITEYFSSLLQAPYQVAVDKQGIVWFTDHPTNEFGSFNPATQEWRKIPVGFCPGYCPTALPNALSFDSQDRIWFSEHLTGRVARFEPQSGVLVEYTVPIPAERALNVSSALTWWAWPGPNNLVWFTSIGLGTIGYVNASVPIPVELSARQGAEVHRGGISKLGASLTYNGDRTVYLGTLTTSLDSTRSGPLISGSFLRDIRTTNSHSEVELRISAAWNIRLGFHQLMVTVSDGQVAFSVPVVVKVSETAIAYPAVTVNASVLLIAMILYLRRRARCV